MKIQMIHGIVFRVGKVNTPYAPGEIVEVTEAEAKQLIAEGSAVALDVEPTEAKPKKTTKVI